LIQVERRFLYARAVAQHLHKPKRRRRFLHIPQHLPEKIIVLLFADSEPRLRQHISERRRRGQFCFTAQQISRDLLLHQVHGVVITDKVMDQPHHEPAVVLYIVRDKKPQHGRLAHIYAHAARVEALI
jgi:hypothetical protein